MLGTTNQSLVSVFDPHISLHPSNDLTVGPKLPQEIVEIMGTPNLRSGPLVKPSGRNVVETIAEKLRLISTSDLLVSLEAALLLCEVLQLVDEAQFLRRILDALNDSAETIASLPPINDESKVASIRPSADAIIQRRSLLLLSVACLLNAFANGPRKALEKDCEARNVLMATHESDNDKPGLPKPQLFSWREILLSLGLPNTEENRGRIRRLNKNCDGPIVLPRRGGQPFVATNKLMQWWNSLESRVDELSQRTRDRIATVESTYDYGRTGKVIPEISGSVKRRRQRKAKIGKGPVTS